MAWCSCAGAASAAGPTGPRRCSTRPSPTAPTRERRSSSTTLRPAGTTAPRSSSLSGLVPSLWGGDETLPAGPLPVPPPLDLEHRLLLAGGRRGDDGASLVDRAVDLAGQSLAQVDPRRVAAGRPSTVRARRAVVDAARGLLAADPDRSVVQLGRELAVSPHHLSRIFHAETGHTISRHRIRLRVRSALERLAGGERDLARLAADVGLADQSHLCRVIRSETGQVPSALRQALTPRFVPGSGRPGDHFRGQKA